MKSNGSVASSWAMLGLCVVVSSALVGGVLIDRLTVVDSLHDAAAEHVHQAELESLVAGGQAHAAFEMAFELGDELFEVEFNALDGVGANVGQHLRFSRVPRADLDESGAMGDTRPSPIDRAERAGVQ